MYLALIAKSVIEYILNNKINIPIGYFIRILVNNIYITFIDNFSIIFIYYLQIYMVNNFKLLINSKFKSYFIIDKIIFFSD